MPGATFTISANTILYARWDINCSGLAGGTWVAVPGDSIYGTQSFCVQKYAASNISSVPTSQAGTAQWVFISQTTAITTCASLGTGFHLMTNPKWMSIGANLANVGSNWSGSTVGVTATIPLVPAARLMAVTPMPMSRLPAPAPAAEPLLNAGRAPCQMVL